MHAYLRPQQLRIALVAGVLTCSALLPGCAVVSAVDMAAGVAIQGVGLAADAAMGAARITGRAVGAVADTVIPGKSP